MRVCQRTHQGRVRSSNQDCLLVDGRVYGAVSYTHLDVYKRQGWS